MHSKDVATADATKRFDNCVSEISKVLAGDKSALFTISFGNDKTTFKDLLNLVKTNIAAGKKTFVVNIKGIPENTVYKNFKTEALKKCGEIELPDECETITPDPFT